MFNLLTKKNRGKKTTKLFFFVSSSSFSSFHFILVFCLCLRLSPLYLGFNFVFYCNTFPSSYFFFQFFNFIFFPSLSSSLPSFFSVVIKQIETVTAKLLLYVSVILVWEQKLCSVVTTKMTKKNWWNKKYIVRKKKIYIYFFFDLFFSPKSSLNLFLKTKVKKKKQKKTSFFFLYFAFVFE